MFPNGFGMNGYWGPENYVLGAALFGDEGNVFLFVPADFISGNVHFYIPLFGNAQAVYNVCFCALKCLHHSALVRIFVY